MISLLYKYIYIVAVLHFHYQVEVTVIIYLALLLNIIWYWLIKSVTQKHQWFLRRMHAAILSLRSLLISPFRACQVYQSQFSNGDYTASRAVIFSMLHNHSEHSMTPTALLHGWETICGWFWTKLGSSVNFRKSMVLLGSNSKTLIEVARPWFLFSVLKQSVYYWCSGFPSIPCEQGIQKLDARKATNLRAQ